MTEQRSPDILNSGYHAEQSEQPLNGDRFSTPEVYLAHTAEVARAYSEEDGCVFFVTHTAIRPLILDTPEKFLDAWLASDADGRPGPFHPTKTGAFAAWARAQGYDAVVVPQSAFQGEMGYAEVAGRLGEPQTILLDPDLARIVGPI